MNPRRPRVSLPSCASFDSSPLRAASPLPRPRHAGVRLRSSASESGSAVPPPPRNPADPLPSYLQGPYPGASLWGPPPGMDSLPRRRAWHSGSSQSANAALRGPGAPKGAGAFGPWCGAGGPPGPGPHTRSEGASCGGSAGDGAPVKRKAWSSDGAESQ